MNKISGLSLLSWRVLIVCTVGAPLLFIPSGIVSLDATKTLWLSVLASISLILYIIHTLRSGTASVPNKSVLIGAGAVAIITLVSSILSSNFYKSFFGQGFELVTAGVIIVSLIGFVLSVIHGSRERIVHMTMWLGAAFILLFVFQILFAFFPDFFRFGILPDISSTLAGKWYDLSIFAGMVMLGSLISIRFLKVGGYMLAVFAFVALASLVTLIFTNFSQVWFSLAVVSLVAVIYVWVRSADPRISSRISAPFTILFIISAAMLFWGNSIAGPVIKSVGVSESEMRLPWQYTLDVTVGSLKNSPLIGVGPNRFLGEYLVNKSPVINQSQYWNVEFSDGFGFIPTLLATTGVLGFLAWIFFGVGLFKKGVLMAKNPLKLISGSIDEYCLMVTGLSALFFWILLFIYVPSQAIVFIALVVTGLFASMIASIDTLSWHQFDYSRPSVRRVSIVMFSMIGILVAVMAFMYVRKVVASAYFHVGIREISAGERDLEEAFGYFKSALAWHETDVYYQALSEINLAKISYIVANATTTPSEATVREVAGMLEEAVQYTRTATEIDPDNYYNYILQARAAETAAFLKANGARETTERAYAEAIVRNPLNPSLYLYLARFEANQGNYEQAKRYVGEAIRIKPNFTEAVFTLVQIQVAEGKIDDAIISAKVATEISPDDPIAFFELGLLYYNNKSYLDAVTALEKAVALSPEYANASYFLGLSYARTGKAPSAISIFEKLASQNPNNSEVSSILENLKEGKSPFAVSDSDSASAAPQAPSPEKRASPPLPEKLNTEELEN